MVLGELHSATKYWFHLGLVNDNIYYLDVLCHIPPEEQQQ